MLTVSVPPLSSLTYKPHYVSAHQIQAAFQRQTRTVPNALSVSYIIVPHLSINISKFKEHQTWWQRSID
ncbi:hypothetical protein SK128_007725 [Halocaridina rubra]|uniref:Uncharacterized protein n=1 Tax=Halocaridina rubra TaxID=373956 RepID=A0AAN8ZT64_HALRR